MLIVERLKAWALTLVAVVLVLAGAYTMGGRAARRAADKKRNYDEALRTAAGAKGARDAQVEVRRMPAGGAADQLRRDWMRDGEGDGGGRDLT